MDCGLSNTKDNALVVVTSGAGVKIRDAKTDSPDNVVFILDVEFNKQNGTRKNINPEQEWQINEIFDEKGERRKSGGVITKVMFTDCGIIIAYFLGRIDILDRCDFLLKGFWDNNK